ncbi:hypothetical protein AC792_14865 [Arthrobacter sp. RIT-PI-e]|uniref:tripartite tricarboxylate transporter TctB family protein n=1 Tax=Arthrobacter sp. RIT-PI-e TaxID=1681197 RepID=UPI000675BD27|nr:tripartite tricarboxylate transporter TctB family protein [Arthrobacter sp. RIT-PI-e]KNC17217.1 hypothetical protein AC792_14865 [Arthrobacter sp. RIT-PI-e]
MSSDTTQHAPDAARQEPPRGFFAGRSELVLALLVAGVGAYLTIGVVTMDVPPGARPPGPQFFPVLIAIASFVLAALLAVQTFRHPEPASAPAAAPAGSAPRYRTHSDWKSLSMVLVAFLAFCLLLEPVGWILSAALMFWAISYALGSRRRYFDPALALVFSSFIQVAFSAGLGLALPSGILEGMF